MDLVEVLIETQGRVGFASREVGRTVDTENYLLNTALYYAFGYAKGRYVDTLHQPTYLEDTEEVADELYIAPAAPIGSSEYWTTTYNARRDQYAVINYSAQDDPDQDKNLPRFGRERTLANGNQFRTFIIPKDSSANDLLESAPSYVRLGKKRGKARVSVQLIKSNRHSGRYVSNHPIGAYDFDKTPLGSVVSKDMRPTPIILQAEYEGEYLEIQQPGRADPVRLPAGLTFLDRKR